MPSWMAMGFQDASSIIMMELIILHDYAMTIMLSIMIIISYIIVMIFYSKSFYLNLSEGTLIETVWSIFPALLLMVLILPSMKVLYFAEDYILQNMCYTYKVIGNQWYWLYNIPIYKATAYYNDEPVTDGEKGGYYNSKKMPRLLKSYNSLILHHQLTARLLITSSDVIHSFAVPSLGLKVDALPGRVNMLFCTPSRVGIFYGQCSEICGTNHSFMPITIKVCTYGYYGSNDQLHESLLL